MKKQSKIAILVSMLILSVVMCISCGTQKPNRPSGGNQSGKESSGGSGSEISESLGNSERESDIHDGSESEKSDESQTDSEASEHVHYFALKIAKSEYLASESDCMNKATYFYSCACGEKSSATFEYGDFGSHRIVTEEGVKPTCTEKGYSDKKYCAVCKTVFQDRAELFPKGHRFVDGVCENCGESEPAHKHTIVKGEEKAVTCTENGYTEYRCAECGEFVDKRIILASGHDYSITIEQNLSCDEDGIIRYDCKNCSDSYTVITHGEHNYEVSLRQAATCEEEGYIVYSCVNCGDDYRETISAGKHNYTYEVIKKATTEATGIRRYTCSICGKTYDEIIPEKVVIEGDVVLLIQDVLPWTELANNDVLAKLVNDGVIVGYDVATTSELSDYDFSDYCAVIIANDQPASSYSRLATYKSLLNEYVENGGVVVYGACDQGWESGDVSSALICDIQKGGNYYSNYNYIVDNAHPIITGELTDGVALTNDVLYGTYASHTYFKSLPESSNVILQDGYGNPTLVEFSYGDGSVIATGLTWEYTYVRTFVKGTSFAKSVFDDMIIYAVSLSGEKCEHRYVSEIVPATCEKKGYTLYVCSVCGRKRKTNFTPALGHSEITTVEREATCTQEGVARITCANCDYSEEKTLPILNHAYELTASLEPTCESNGYSEYVCAVCGATTGRYTVFALGHDYVSEVIQDISCETDGIIRYSCLRCDKTYDVVTKGEHNYCVNERRAATCAEEGYVEYVCSNCGDSYREVIPTGKHDYEYKIVKRATEVTTGIRRYTCSVCGDSYDEIIPVKIAGDTVLLIQDVLPWTTSSNTMLLSSLAKEETIVGYDVISSKELAEIDLDEYCVVIIANDQTSSFYNALSGNKSKLTSYVENGGVVVYGACDQGWENGDVSSALIGEIQKGGNYYSNYNYIVNGNHPIVTGELTDDIGLTDELLYGNYCSHTYFENLPENSDIILQDGNGNPTLVEFSLGSGTVIATGLTWEFYYVRNMVGSTSFSKNVFDDMICYAVSLTGDKCAHNYKLVGTVEAACEEAGYSLYSCDNCGKIRKTDYVEALGHDFVDRICSRCGMRDTTPCETHTLLGYPFDEDAYYVYEGEITSVVKLFANSESLRCSEPTSGYFTCTVCQNIVIIYVVAPHTVDWVVVEPTCTKEGYSTGICSVCDCGVTTDIVPALGHDYAYTVDEENRTIMCECDRCGDVDAINYTEIIETENTQATCMSEGEITYTVTSVTGDKIVIAVKTPKTNHKFRGIEIDRNRIYDLSIGFNLFGNTMPSCGETAQGYFVCDVCANVIMVNVTVSHKVTYITVEPTCTEDGYSKGICSVCAQIIIGDVVPALGHDIINHDGKAATCTESGYRAYETCSRCDYTTYEAIPALGHDLTYFAGVAATCTENGYEDYEVCSRCEYSSYEEIPALGHDYRNGKCARCGLSDGSGEIGGGDIYTRDGDYIYFGTYPQTKVVETDVISALNSMAGTLPVSGDSYGWTSYGYYISGSVQDYMWYKDETYNGSKYRGVYFTSYRPCLIENKTYIFQSENGYYISTVYWFKYESVKWRILTESNGRAFLMCDMAIDSQQYYHTSSSRTIDDKTVYANNYAESEIRKWLNETFYNTAFNEMQKAIIKTTNVDNSAKSTNLYNDPTYWNNGENEYVCENTNDKVFLLSESEVTNSAYGFSGSVGEDLARQLKSSDYAKSQGCWQYTGDGCCNGNCWWWLRSPLNDNNYCAWIVYTNFCGAANCVDRPDGGVVPALWIDLNCTKDGLKARYDSIESEKFETHDDLLAAINRTDGQNVTLEMVSNCLTGSANLVDAYFEVKYNYDQLAACETCFLLEDNTVQKALIAYENGIWYTYEQENDSEWVRTKSDGGFEIANISDILESLGFGNLDDFSWNETKKLYETTVDSGVLFEIKFTDGVVSAFGREYTDENGKEYYLYAVLYDYGTTTITIPDVFTEAE